MNMRITPKALSGTVRAVASKSDAHRLLIASALCETLTTIALNESNADIAATAACLRALGADIREETGGVRVKFARNGTGVPVLDCAESGSTLRFLLPVAAAIRDGVAFAGRGRLPGRPLEPLLEQMKRNGCAFSRDALPFTLSGKLRAGGFALPGNVSSQFISGLLFALPLLDGESRVGLTSPLQSRPYVDMTIQTLARFGIRIGRQDNGYTVSGNQTYISPGGVTVEGDWSGAAFFLAAGALGGEMSAQGLGVDSLQADKAIADTLQTFGATVSYENGVTVRPGRLAPAKIDVSRFPDLFPPLAVVACGAVGKSQLYNAGRLRFKESDRLASVARMLRALGGNAEEMRDALVIHGTGALTGGRVDSAGDHRIAMAAAVASILCTSDVVIEGAQCCAKSYPRFFEDFRQAGGKADVE
jgi:3-phosphoshikimate 1-carboxyvinyltransferase